MDTEPFMYIISKWLTGFSCHFVSFVAVAFDKLIVWQSVINLFFWFLTNGHWFNGYAWLRQQFLILRFFIFSISFITLSWWSLVTCYTTRHLNGYIDIWLLSENHFFSNIFQRPKCMAFFFLLYRVFWIWVTYGLITNPFINHVPFEIRFN